MNAHCISCRVPLRWPPRRDCTSRQPHYDVYRDRPLTGLPAMLWDLRDAATRHARLRAGGVS